MAPKKHSSDKDGAPHASADEDQDLQAIREAISDMEAGDEGIPLDDAIDQLRNKAHPSNTSGKPQ